MTQTNLPDEKREYLIDNLKLILITLVVMGHFYGNYMQQSIYIKAVVLCIYSFHMPVFVFISGYLSKSANSSNPQRLFKTLLLPYLLFSLLWFFKESFHNKVLYLDVTNPPFHLWYLLSLFCWRLLLPTFKTIRFYLVISIIISLLVGFSPLINTTLSLSRTITMFPFFILGTVCSTKNLLWIQKQKYFIPVGLALLVTTGVMVIKYNNIDLRYFLWDNSYQANGLSNYHGVMIRSLLMLTATLTGLSVIALTSIKRFWFSKIGSATITVYIFHAFLLPSFAKLFPLWGQGLIFDIIIITSPFFIVYLLSLPLVENVYQRSMMKLGALFVNQSTSPYI